MAILSRRYKFVGYDMTTSIVGVTDMGIITEGLNVLPVILRKTIQYDTTQTDPGTTDYLMKSQGWAYDP